MSEIKCNACGRTIIYGEMHNKEDYLVLEKEWGYFSKKDGKKYKIRMCEDCFDSLVGSLRIPPQIDDITEY